MILAFDTYYFDNKAKTVCISFNSWTDKSPINVYNEIIKNIAEYEPGSFYKRELPCILALLEEHKLKKILSLYGESFSPWIICLMSA